MFFLIYELHLKYADSLASKLIFRIFAMHLVCDGIVE